MVTHVSITCASYRKIKLKLERNKRIYFLRIVFQHF